MPDRPRCPSRRARFSSIPCSEGLLRPSKGSFPQMGKAEVVSECGQRRLTAPRSRCHIAPVNPDMRLISRRHVDLCRQASAVCAVRA
ncbi:putative leader peptide [Streptomyces sp. NPDC003314]